MSLDDEAKILLKETEDYQDALHYVDELAEDCGVTRLEAINALRRVLGLEEIKSEDD